MPTSALLLALAAAGLHALWNVLIAGARDTQAASAVMLVLSLVLFAPAAALTWDVEASAVPFIAGSAALELAYFALLAAAYRRAELTLVYPVARGSAPVLVIPLAAAALGVVPSALQGGGVALVAAGIVLVRGGRARGGAAGAAFALLIGACIAGYTLLDQQGVEHASALAYLELVLVPVAIASASVVAARGGVGALRREVRLRSAATAGAMFGAYALVLLALRLAPAAPVAAVREASVLIAVALAAVVLRERVTPMRAAGAVLVVAGVAVIGVS